MDPHHGMGRVGVHVLHIPERLAAFGGPGKQMPPRLEVVDSLESRNKILHAVGKAFIGGRHTAEHGVTADLRRDLRPQDGAEGWRFPESLIRVPDIGTIGFFVPVVVKHDHFRRFRNVWRERMDAELPKAFAEHDLLFDADVLIAEYDDLMIQERLVDCPHRRRVRRPGCVNTVDFRTQMRANLFDLDC